MTKRFAASTLEDKVIVQDHSNQDSGSQAAYTWTSGAIGPLGATAPVINLSGHRITGAPTAISDFTNDSDLVSKAYVEARILGLKWKEPVRVATTANIASLSGLLTVDGITLVANDRVLVKDQTTTTENGIYVAASGSWTRSLDMDASSEFVSAAVFIQEGATYGDQGWTCTVDGTFVLDTDPVTFVQFSGSNATPLATNLVAGRVKPASNAGLDIDSFGAGSIGILLPTVSGLQTGASGLSLKLDTDPGLVLAAAGLKVLLDAAAHSGNGSGLALSSTGLSVKAEASNPTLAVTASGELQVKYSSTAAGLTQDATGLKVKVEASNPTLQINGSGELGAKLDAAGAIVTGAAGLSVQSGNGLEIVTNTLRAKLGATDYSGNATIVFDGTDNGLQAKVNNTTGGLKVTASGIEADVDGTSLTKNGNTLQVGKTIEKRRVETLTLDNTDVTTNKYKALANLPDSTNYSAVKMYVLKSGGVGPDQEYAVDFSVMTNTGVAYVVWTTSSPGGFAGTPPSVGMDGDLVSGDKLIVEFASAEFTPA